MIVTNAKSLDEQDHELLAIWASDCAEHVLPYFEKIYPEDDRPRKAIEAARAWAHGDLPMVETRKAAFASHAAARVANNAAAQAAARAAGHAAATAHVADHARHAATYAVKATTGITGSTTAAESDWQYQQLPEHLRSAMFPTSRYKTAPNDVSEAK
jgi:hypothetical protein